jgi:hypothetical protein
MSTCCSWSAVVLIPRGPNVACACGPNVGHPLERSNAVPLYAIHIWDTRLHLRRLRSIPAVSRKICLLMFYEEFSVCLRGQSYCGKGGKDRNPPGR